MLVTKACPRCQGDLAYVSDVGDTYYSCVQCGHVVYHLTPAMITAHTRSQAAEVAGGRPTRTKLVPVPRDEVHRRRIRQRIEEQRRVA